MDKLGCNWLGWFIFCEIHWVSGSFKRTYEGAFSWIVSGTVHLTHSLRAFGMMDKFRLAAYRVLFKIVQFILATKFEFRYILYK